MSDGNRWHAIWLTVTTLLADCTVERRNEVSMRVNAAFEKHIETVVGYRLQSVRRRVWSVTFEHGLRYIL